MNMIEPRRILSDIEACLSFYTRLPLPRRETAAGALAAAHWAAPIAGLIVALLGAAVFALVYRAGVGSFAAAALALGTTMLVTGCLHEDGLADTADGFGGGATREGKLEIMRDSAIGTYGVAILMVALLTRWSAVAWIGAPGLVLPSIVAAHAASRSVIPAFMRWSSSARTEGLAASAGTPSGRTALIAVVLGFAALLLLGPAAACVAVLGLAIWLVVFSVISDRQIGGYTGDTLGALQQGAEIVVLLVAASATT